MKSNSVCTHTSDNQSLTISKQGPDLLIGITITDRIGQHDVLLPINHNHYNTPQKKKVSVEKSF